ncbi:type III-B CRISPR-associated protein Cas10/Cmr2 [Vibrio aerogenes]|uniref:type III-B CRISPR-associated protein Cas10/Cmr2 n=1 Tax=Vibrio aerogenes TaxID=92172 RepID=UPI0021C48A93|nr:type III-B CRISPR-associated protein Cas10/Cmr2 [Vibrio aerogenes]
MARNNKSKKYFHFSISPVQPFITSGRRTRDFWAGSFLISFLCAVAQRSVTIRCNQQTDDSKTGKRKVKSDHSKYGPVLPEENEQIKKAVQKKERFGPKHACLPNRFSALVPKDFNSDNADEIVNDVRTYWRLMWQAVFKNDLEPFFENRPGEDRNRCQQLWERQLGNYWEIQWAITPDLKTGFEAMKSRKLLRQHLPSEQPEPGVKCNYFAGLQEMSGITKPAQGTSLQQTVVEQFWSPLRDHQYPTSEGDPIRLEHDIDDQEMLSAVAYFKRRFPYYFPLFIYQDETSVFHPIRNRLKAFFTKTQLPDSEQFTLSGWCLDSRVPSVSFLAARNWLWAISDYIQQENDQALRSCFRDFIATGIDEYLGKSHYLKDSQTEFQTAFADISSSIAKINGNSCYDFLLEGERDSIQRHLSKLENQRKYHSDQNKRGQISRQIDELRQQQKCVSERLTQLNRLKNELLKRDDTAGFSAPESYYAVVALDADKLGRFISKKSHEDNTERKISSALQSYTTQAQQTVKKHHGFLIYAGGEDLVALLPGADALNCACQLRRDFVNAIKLKDSPTISAAVLFSHINVPLMRVLRDVQQLLSGVAKQQYDRDAIAIRIVNQGGVQQQWGAKWSKFINSQGRIALYNIIDGLRDSGEVTSNNFLYHLRHITQQLGMLRPERHHDDFQTRNNNFYGTESPEPKMLKALVVAQYLRAQGRTKQVKPQWMDELFSLCEEITIKEGHRLSTHYFNPDIAFIAKFLCSKVNCKTTPDNSQTTQEAQA